MAHASLDWYWNLRMGGKHIGAARRVGLPPQFDFSASQNVENISIDGPHRIFLAAMNLPRLDTKNRSYAVVDIPKGGRSGYSNFAICGHRRMRGYLYSNVIYTVPRHSSTGKFAPIRVDGVIGEWSMECG